MTTSEYQKRWVANNLERRREQARNYVKRQMEKDPEIYREKARAIAKKSREKHIEKYKAKSNEYKKKMIEEDREGYNLKQKEYRLNNKEKFKQYYEKRKGQQKIYSRIQQLKKYGLTLETFETMLLQQEGKCAICKINFSESEKPNIDHCHEKGHVRGLLCSPCNIVLGYMEKTLKRNPNTYDNFIKYLKIPSNQQ